LADVVHEAWSVRVQAIPGHHELPSLLAGDRQNVQMSAASTACGDRPATDERAGAGRRERVPGVDDGQTWFGTTATTSPMEGRGLPAGIRTTPW
jgi:hypothetical protein